MQDVAAPDRVAGHHADDRLGQAADLHLEIQHVEPRHAVAADVSGLPPHALVASRTEGFRAGAGKHHHADGCVLPRVCHAPRHLLYRVRRERVALGRAIYCDLQGGAARQSGTAPHGGVLECASAQAADAMHQHVHVDRPRHWCLEHFLLSDLK